MELFDALPDVNVPTAEYVRLLGYPRGWQLEGRARGLAEFARAWFGRHGRPWIAIRRALDFSVADGAVVLEGERFEAPPLAATLSNSAADGVALAAVSAGPEVEAAAQQAWRDAKPDEYFFLEVYGSAVVEHLVTLAGARMCAWAESRGGAVTPHYSPGYPSWNVAEQPRLLALLARGAGPSWRVPLETLDSGMLRPKKSLVAAFGLTQHPELVRDVTGLAPCARCSLAACQYRRMPYTAPLELAAAETLTPRGTHMAAQRASIAEPAAASIYSVNIKALRRWSEERLTLQPREDGSIDARFRYDGTTCNNLGQPLAFDYEVLLAPRRDAFRLLRRACRPAASDLGHRSMCQFAKDGDELLATIAEEAPPEGASLIEAMAWPQASSAAGCYCDGPSRRHKWGLVLETIHFALDRRATSATSELIRTEVAAP
jgi:hypothetical protein